MDWEKDALDLITRTEWPFALILVASWFRRPLRDLISSAREATVGDATVKFNIQQQADVAGASTPPIQPKVVPDEAGGATKATSATLSGEQLHQIALRSAIGWRYERVWRIINVTQLQFMISLKNRESLNDQDALTFYNTLDKAIRHHFSYVTFVSFLTSQGFVSATMAQPGNVYRITDDGRLFLKFIDMVNAGVPWPTISPGDPWVIPPLDAPHS